MIDMDAYLPEKKSETTKSPEQISALLISA